MTYAVLLERRADRELRRLPDTALRRVNSTLEALSSRPIPRGAVKLRGEQSEGWRVRVGDYRILYTIDDSRRVVTVYRIGHRRDVYLR